MLITDRIELTFHKNGTFTLRENGIIKSLADFGIPKDADLLGVYNKMIGRPLVEKEVIFKEWVKSVADVEPFTFEDSVTNTSNQRKEETEEEKQKKVKENILTGLKDISRFFSEFAFTPSFRFINSLGHSLKNSADEAKTYIANYFKLIDSPYTGEMMKKMESFEFKKALSDLSHAEMTHTVNNRFRIYYGSQGTGKTTQAMSETDNLCIVCNSSMLPADLMEDFTFDDGKAAFHPSALARCMEEGKAIVLDEINLLPFDSLRFLQGIFDGKTEFQYKGQTVHIREGFKVIGTMNLTVNGVTFGLPEPLVDRCEVIKEFVLLPEMLLGAF